MKERIERERLKRLRHDEIVWKMIKKEAKRETQQQQEARRQLEECRRLQR